MNRIYQNNVSPGFDLITYPEPQDIIEYYTDGSCPRNPGPAGAGFIMRWQGHYREFGYFADKGTNNTGELTAIYRALCHGMRWRELHAPGAEIKIHTDSQYSLGVLLMGWRAKANVALITKMKAKLKEARDGGFVSFEKVKGHSNHALNDRADWVAGHAVNLGLEDLDA